MLWLHFRWTEKERGSLLVQGGLCTVHLYMSRFGSLEPWARGLDTAGGYWSWIGETEGSNMSFFFLQEIVARFFSFRFFSYIVFFSIPSCESIFIHHSVIRIPQIFLCSSHFSISILLLLRLAFCLSVYVHLIQQCCADSAACHFPIFQAGVSLVVTGDENGDATQHAEAEKRSQILLKNVKVRVFKARLVSL